MRLMHVLASDPINWVRGQLRVTGVSQILIFPNIVSNLTCNHLTHINISIRLTLIDREVRRDPTFFFFFFFAHFDTFSCAV